LNCRGKITGVLDLNQQLTTFLMRILFILFLMLPLLAKAQFTYSIDQSVPVEKIDGTAVNLPWAGGLNAVQTNTLDLNHDGKDDLVLFDRMGNKVLTYLRTETSFSYNPEYEEFFPEDVLNWVLLRDFNCDGKKDLFTGDNLGIKVYINTTTSEGNPTWQRFYFSTGFPGSKSGVLLSKGFTSKVNVQIQFDDLPSISDVDGDGDLDLFVMRYVANGQIEFHKNFSKERYNTCDSLDFERITQSWGNVRECTCGTFAFNGDDCSASGGRSKHAGGKSLLALDLNGNQSPEMLISEAECSQLFALNNQGTLLAPVVNNSSGFPTTTPAFIITYPAAYFEDIDADGKNDLMVSSNLFIREFLNSDFASSNWYYRNTGTNSNPNFSLVQRNFLQSEMIDMGDNSVPALFDFDGDEDLDLFISSHSKGFRSPISLYENTGNATAPSFQLLTEDYLGFSFLNDFNRKIQFADIDNDNTSDLVFTSTDANNGVTFLNFVSNRSTSGADFGNQSVTQIAFQLNRNENVFVFDVSGDGKNDLLVGRSDGSVELWNQTGPLTFTLAESDYLGLSASVLRQNISIAIADLDADGTLDFIYGDHNGLINIVPDFKNVVNAETSAISSIVFNPLLENYVDQKLGGRIWPTAANLFGSTRPSLVVGNALGGLHILNSQGPELPSSPVIDVYPNPLTESQTLSVRIDRPAVLEIYSLLGQRISDPVRMQPFTILQTSLPSLASGIYVLKFSVGKKSYSKKLIIDR
jgi:hypothetical protein